MAAIKGANTRPEKVVRVLVHRMGFRFGLHRKDLPGSPDIVFPRLRKVIFVHGCFWHGHKSCKRAKLPKTNRKFWAEKIGANKRRDIVARNKLRGLGWGALTLWQCQITQCSPKLATLIAKFLTDR